MGEELRYIWIGIGVDGQLASIRVRVAELEKEWAVADSNLTLPFHISLKMSFPMRGRADEAIALLEAYFRGQSGFEIPVKGYEYLGNIAWIRMSENEDLDRIHDELNQMLYDDFGVGLHEYDRDYLFHTTLFMDENAEKVRRCYDAILETPCPARLSVEHYLIGVSNSGALGSYRVVREIVPEKNNNEVREGG